MDIIVKRELIETILIQSLQRLYEIDETNIKYEVSERKVSHRLTPYCES